MDRYLVLLNKRGGHWREWRGDAADWDDACEKAAAENPGWEVHTAGFDPANVQNATAHLHANGG